MGLGQKTGLLLVVGLVRDDGDDASVSSDLAVGLAGIALVTDRRARIDVGTEPKQDREVRRVALLTAGQVEGDEVAVEIGLQVDLGGEAAA